MKRQPGDAIYTFQVNLSEVARTNWATELHPFTVLVEILKDVLHDLEPSVTKRSVVWNGVNAGSLSITFVPKREPRRRKATGHV
jgi:hypothetical protein